MTSTDVAVTATAITAQDDGAWRELMDATAGWIRDQNSRDTRDAYRRDVTGVQPDGQTPAKLRTPAWLPWCAANRVHPLEARVRHVSAYARQLEADGLSPATRARKLSAISSWYDYLMRDDITERNPARVAKRPNIDKSVSDATGLSEEEAGLLLDAAGEDGPRSAALFSLLYFGSFRVGSVLNATVGDLGWDQGERTLRLKVKGGTFRRPVIEPEAAVALDAYLASRGKPGPAEPLLLSDEGGRLSKQAAWRTLRRLARHAGIKSWAQLNPHSLRHSHITHALDNGVSLDEVRETAGHRSVDTTRRYDRARQRRAARSGRVLSERRAAVKAARANPNSQPG